MTCHLLLSPFLCISFFYLSLFRIGRDYPATILLLKVTCPALGTYYHLFCSLTERWVLRLFFSVFPRHILPLFFCLSHLPLLSRVKRFPELPQSPQKSIPLLSIRKCFLHDPTPHLVPPKSAFLSLWSLSFSILEIERQLPLPLCPLPYHTVCKEPLLHKSR